MRKFKTGVNFIFILITVGAGNPSNCDSLREKRFALLQTNFATQSPNQRVMEDSSTDKTDHDVHADHSPYQVLSLRLNCTSILLIPSRRAQG
jgi:hypothetical protein